MNTLCPWYRFVARLSLAVAALLYAAGAAAGPALHAGVVRQEAGQEESRGGQSEQAEHDAQHCVLCHSPGQGTLAVGAVESLVVTLAWSPAFREPSVFAPTRWLASTRARAPPRV